ncbi:bifunctional 2',3'-cyclic-nucleotide 2'-phosphodiesterase/3'-nucleotidase, partial [Aquabacterium sp.]|uniref:bifunctional 2',3'-cyclic-nucleotide 2'-phosphodiesterase/3'-nucleotidase n=1 Tax=Aquabacterium sp. TaxID=1872578 RepID=UPI003782F042
VAIPHSGLEFGLSGLFGENMVGQLAEVPGIDAILFGHSHGEFPGLFFTRHPKVNLERGTINGVPAVMPGAWGSHLGLIDLVLDDSGGRWQVKDARAFLRPVYDRAKRQPLVEPDPMVAQLIGEAHDATVAYMRAEVARTAAPITSYFALVADDPSVQVVAQAQRSYAEAALKGTEYAALPLLSAAAPFKSGGRMGWNYYTDVPAGPIALRNVASLYIYPNTVKAVKLTGAQVREWLEMSAGQFNRIDPAGPAEQNLINDAYVAYNFDMIEGISYEIDVTQPARYNPRGQLVSADAHRIVNLRYRGAPLDEKAAFVVVTNNYRASGGGGFPGLDGSNIVLDAQDQTRETLVQYLAAQKELDVRVDNNWRIRPVPGVKLRFLSGAAGVPLLPRYPQVKLVRENTDGSALYELAP